MMGKTHYFIGMASAMLACQPNDEKTILLALAGGALGGVAADIDTVDNDYKCDALIGQLLGIGTAAAMLAIDYLKPSGICSALFTSEQGITKMGAIAYLILMVIGFVTDHRTFTHSFLSLALFTVAAYMILPGLSIPYAIGYLSHLILDILNKKPVPVLYPIGKGFCLNLCYAGKTANTFFMFVGLVGTVFLIVNAVFLHLF